MNEKALRRDLHARAARRGLIVKRDDSRYRAFLHDNYGVESSTQLTFRQLQEAAGLLRGAAPALRHRARREGSAPAPFPAGPPAEPRTDPAVDLQTGKVIQLSRTPQWKKRLPADRRAVKKIFAYGYNNLGWDNRAIRQLIERITEKDIRGVEDPSELLTDHDVDRVLGSMRATYRHHKKARPADNPADAEASR